MKVVSYNSRGLPLSMKDLHHRPCVKYLLDQKYDIVCLQETWYGKQDLPNLNTIHRDYHGTGSTVVDYSEGLRQGRNFGGVAVLWRDIYDEFVTPLDFNENWLTGIQLCKDDRIHVILCVYLPYECQNNEEEYLDKLGKLKAILEELETTCVSIYGDWNADISDGTSLFGNHLKHFCHEHDLIISTGAFLPTDTFTYLSERGSTSWLDHCVSTSDGHNVILDMKVLYSEALVDHFPVHVNISFDLVPQVECKSQNVTPKLNWGSVSETSKQNYCNLTDIYLSNIHVPKDTLMCNDVNCKNESHVQSLENLYNDLISAMTKSSDECIQQGDAYAKSSHSRPGWNDHASDLHKAAREFFMIWVEAGKPKQGAIFELMKNSRARFKYAMRFLKRHEKELVSNALANKLAVNKPENFWEGIKKINNCNTPLPSSVDGVTGADKITDLWRSHFKDLFNCIGDRTFTNLEYDISYCNEINVSIAEIEGAIKELDCNKSCGMDGIYAEHLKYCSNRILPLLAMCVSGLFVHGFLPNTMLSVILVPVIKDKCGKINSKDNYRPIALASIVSKIVEIILLDRMSDLITTKCNQFGFKRNLGTDMCIYVLKEIIDRYRCLGGSTFLCFLDASKAFDRVNHTVLFKKLIDRKVPGFIIRILMYWYSSQLIYVRWSGCMSAGFKVSNGVRQGGILSPHLFNLYMNDLSSLLNDCDTGCYIGDCNVNHLMYADDLVLIAPSSKGLKNLLSVCERYGTSHDIKYNHKKSAILFFRGKYLKHATIPNFEIRGNRIEEADYVKYLGHYISNNLRDDKDVLRQCRQFYARGNLLVRKFSACTGEVKAVLFKSYCTSMYTAQLWWNYTVCSMHKLHVAYNNVFRMLFKLPRQCSASEMFAVNGIPTSHAVLRKLVYKFMQRLNLSDNKLIRAILSSDLLWLSRIRRHWTKMIYLHHDVG